MLTLFQTRLQELSLMQNSWASDLNPIIKDPTNQGLLLKDLELSSGVNTINHRLGRTPQGWVLIDIDGAATVYRSQPLNNKTLTLTVSTPVTASIWVF